MVFDMYMYISSNLLGDTFYLAEELKFSARSYVEYCSFLERLNFMFRNTKFHKVFFTSVNLGDICVNYGDLPDSCQLKIPFDE